MKMLVIWGLVALALASYGLALAGGIIRADKVRESREASERNDHSEAGAVVRRPPVASQSTSLAAARDPMVGGW